MWAALFGESSATDLVPNGHNEAGDDSALSMVIKRMNQLVIKVGEHEFEKKKLVEGMEQHQEELRSKVRSLEETIRVLREENEQLQFKNEYSSDEMLLERLQDATDMREALNLVKAQLETELEEKEKENLRLQGELDSVRAETHECKTFQQEVENKEKLLKDNKIEYEAKISGLMQDISDAERETRGLKENNKLLQNQMALIEEQKDKEVERVKNEYWSSVEELQAKFHQDISELATIKDDEILSIKSELDHYTTLHSEASKKVLEMAENVNDLKEFVKQKQDEILRSVKECERLSQINEVLVNKMQTQGAQLTTGISWKDDTVQILTDQVSSSQRELSDAMELTGRLSSRNNWLEARICVDDTKLATELSDLMEKTVSEHKNYENEKQKLLRELAALEDECGNLKAKIKEVQELESTTQEIVAQLRSDLHTESESKGRLGTANTDLELKLSKLKSNLNESTERNVELENRYSEASEQLVSIQQVLENSKSQCATYIEKYNAVCSELAGSRQRTQDLEENVQLLTNTNEELKQQLNNENVPGEKLKVLEAHNEALAKENVELRERNSCMHGQKEELATTILGLSEDVKERDNKIQSLLEQMEALESSRAILESSVIDDKELFNRKIGHLSEECDALRSELIQYEAKIMEKDKDLQSLHNSNEISINQVNLIKKKSDEQEHEILSLREQISVYQSSIVNLENHLLTEKEVHEKENGNLSSQLENTIEVRQQVEAELIKYKDMCNLLQGNVNQLKVELLNLADENKKYVIKENCLQDECDRLSLELANRKEMLKNLSNDLRILEDANSKLNLKLVELENQSEHLNEVNKSLRKECEKSQEKMKELQGELEQLVHSRLEHECRVEVLRLENADLKAESNILSARATRLKEHLAEYTEVGYDDDDDVGGHPQTADLWDLLASGMEQLKVDLEIASKYAASIETPSLD